MIGSKQRTRWLCLCECGHQTIVQTDLLRAGRTKFCGCLKLERARDANITYGLYYHPLRKGWHQMIMRCVNPNNAAYKHYGGPRNHGLRALADVVPRVP